MAEAGGGLDGILRRLDELERQVLALKADMEETKDVQLMEKLDIINLKNEVEAMEMARPEIAAQREETRTIEDLAADLRVMKEQLSRRNIRVCCKCGGVVSGEARFCGGCGGKV